MSNDQQFREDIRSAVRKAIARARCDGTVSMGDDCLWQCTVSHIRSQAAPHGVNAAWVARQVFNQVITEKPFNKFVYVQ